MYDKLHRFTVEDGLLSAGLALITVGVGYNLTAKYNENPVQLVKGVVTPTVIQVDVKVTFDISGEVLKPGVYVLAKGSRINEAMAVAGGLAANADRDWVEKNINRAKAIGDGEKIYIPRQQPMGQAKINTTQAVLGAVDNGIINLNTAGLNDLDKLDGIGPAIAQRIIDYREKNGTFKDINEIKMVSGIGEALFSKIKEKIGI